ncbi:hypothetical protein MVEN_01095700 [Mycena venus]|uniref:Uncharacterized protein n=1 Tax=Mycena venus TaxID=2733690 RepID=A0A8H6Y6C0_9AGAR|nr:hypothetical protein MVEN_01095700 [Mycena venus]
MFPTQPPSLQLPPVRSLITLSPDVLLDCVEYLRLLYTPGVRGSKIRHRLSSDSSELPTAASTALTRPLVSNLDLENTPDMVTWRSDEFERAYTIRWLSYLINNVEKLQGAPSDVDSVVSQAAALLANCAGASSAGVVTRTLDFPSAHGPISITLRDIPLENGDIASVGAQTWGGACVLSEIIAAHPADFGVMPDLPSKLRVLELGAGTGLVGLVLATLAKRMDIPVTVTRSALQCRPTPSIGRCFLKNTDPLPLHAPLDEPFDIILGADIIYEPEHAAWIHACVSRLLDRGRSKSQFHLVIPLRRTHTLESSSVELVFRDCDQDLAQEERTLTILSKETILCDVEEHANNTAEENQKWLKIRLLWRSSKDDSPSNRV